MDKQEAKKKLFLDFQVHLSISQYLSIFGDLAILSAFGYHSILSPFLGIFPCFKPFGNLSIHLTFRYLFWTSNSNLLKKILVQIAFLAP